MSDKSKVMVVLNVHEDGVWKSHVKKLQLLIESAYKAHANEFASLKFAWFQIPHKQGWLAGELSTASTLIVPAPDGISQEKREKLMGQICKGWMEITGCSVDEIIVNAMADSEVQRYMQVSQTRFDPKKAKSMKLKMLASLMLNRVGKGFLTASINRP